MNRTVLSETIATSANKELETQYSKAIHHNLHVLIKFEQPKPSDDFLSFFAAVIFLLL